MLNFTVQGLCKNKRKRHTRYIYMCQPHEKILGFFKNETLILEIRGVFLQDLNLGIEKVTLIEKISLLWLFAEYWSD